MQNQKEIEALYFKKFCQLYFNKVIEFQQPNPPEPDIVFHIDQIKVGSEITLICLDHSKQGGSIKKKNESINRRLADEIKRIIIKKYPKNYIINLHFDYNKEFIIKDLFSTINQIAEYLTEKISALESIQNGNAYYKERISHSNMNQYIDFSIESYDIPAGFKTIVNYGFGGIIPQIRNKDLHPYIQNKNIRMKDYKGNYSAHWLLLISQENLSSDFEIRDTEKLDKSLYMWHKIFILRLYDNIIIEL